MVRKDTEHGAVCVAGGAKAGLAVRYKFHEGYTNAVKRPLRMKDLL